MLYTHKHMLAYVDIVAVFNHTELLHTSTHKYALASALYSAFILFYFILLYFVPAVPQETCASPPPQTTHPGNPLTVGILRLQSLGLLHVHGEHDDFLLLLGGGVEQPVMAVR